MAGTLRLSNTGTGNGQSTITTAASGDTTYTLPSGGGTFVTTGSTESLTVPFALGSASAPSVTFIGDTNTGLYSPGADQVAISTNSVGRLFIDSSGNVGLGISPTTRFHVYQSGSTQAGLIETNQSASVLNFKSTGQSSGQPQVGCAGSDMILNTNGSERLRITSDGKVGLGTSSPDVTLDCRGIIATNSALYCYNSARDGLGIWYNPGGAGVNQLTARIAGSDRLTIDSSGRVGVGTTSPGDRLHVVGPTAGISARFSDGVNATLAISHPSSGTSKVSDYGGNYGLEFASTSLNLLTAGSERARIDSSGRLGIGTSSAQQALHVSQSGGNSFAGIRSQNSNTGTGIAGIEFSSDSTYAKSAIGLVRGDVNGVGSLVFYNASSTGAANWSTSDARMVIDSQGRVGVGTTSPSARFVASNSGAEGFEFYPGLSSNLNRVISYNRSNGTYNEFSIAGSQFSFNNGSSEFFRCDSSGRLLVGTSTARTNFYNQAGTYAPRIQLESADASSGGTMMSAVCAGGNAFASYLILGKHRGSVGGTPTLVNTNEQIGSITFQAGDGSEMVETASITAEIDGTPGTNDMPGRLVFSTTADGASSPTERLRIDSYGSHAMYSTVQVAVLSTNYAASASNTLLYARYGATGVNGGTDCLYIRSNGNIQNTNNSYGAISDIKLKENIVDAGSQWDDLKALRVRKYNFKEGQTHTQIGLIAQEAELVSPGLVTESPDRDAEGNDLGTVTKSVNYSVLYMKAVKALQEAMERIETLEASNTDLLARVSALESA